MGSELSHLPCKPREAFRRIDVDFDRLVVDRAFDNAFPLAGQQGAGTLVPGNFHRIRENRPAEEDGIAASSVPHRDNRERHLRRLSETGDKAVDDGCADARHIGEKNDRTGALFRHGAQGRAPANAKGRRPALC